MNPKIKLSGNSRGRTKKHLDEYLEFRNPIESKHIKFEDYAKCPSTTFLRYAVDVKDALEYCKKYFQKNTDGNYNKDSRDSLTHISVALLPSLMGHFETFQKSTFAGLFEYSRFLDTFNVKSFIGKIEKIHEFRLDVNRISAYRGQPAPIGQLLADSLYCWHDPRKVNSLIGAFDVNVQFYDNTAIEDLDILWQLRHSIVHVGGWLTRPDSQKVKRLSGRGERPIIFNDAFIFALSKRMHRIVADSMGRLRMPFCKKIPQVVLDFSEDVETFFSVDSRNKTWL